MTGSPEEFGKSIVTVGLLSADEIQAYWTALPTAARPKDKKTFAKLLIEQGKLTEFQAQELLNSSGTPLVLGDYILLDRIGAGGMGQVFKAHHRRMDRLVAIKLLPTALTQDAAAIKRFEREVKAAAKLSHPNIVHANDASVQQGVWYLVMEYVEGRDLATVLQQDGPLPITSAVNYIRQAACGLAFAHESGVVHRDVKPANLLLDKKGTVKILDMGLARFDDQNPALAAAQEGLTQSGQVMGTLDYMAPEQALDTRQADARADIYSLGCTLYKLLTCQNMYAGETIVQKLIAHQRQPIPDLAAIRPDASPVLLTIFERMVAKRPDDRYPSMHEVESALGALLTASPPWEVSRVSGLSPRPVSATSQHTLSLPSLEGTSAGAQFSAATGNSQSVADHTANVSPTISVSETQLTTELVSDRSIRLASEHERITAKTGWPPIWHQPGFLMTVGLVGALLLGVLLWGFNQGNNRAHFTDIETENEAGTVNGANDSAITGMTLGSVDLLARVAQLPQGWQRTGEGIEGTSPGGTRSNGVVYGNPRKLVLPYPNPGSYRLDIEFTRLSGDHDLNIIFPVDTRHRMLVSKTDFVNLSPNGNRQAASLWPLDRHKISITVELCAAGMARIMVDVNGTELLWWLDKQESASRELPDTWKPSHPGSIELGLFASKVVFHSVRLTSLEGTDFPSDPPLVTEPKPGVMADVLPLIEPNWNARYGRWLQQGTSLVSSTGEHMMLELPIRPARSFSIDIEAERLTGTDDLGLILPVSGSHVRLLFEGYFRRLTGLDCVDGVLLEAVMHY